MFYWLRFLDPIGCNLSFTPSLASFGNLSAILHLGCFSHTVFGNRVYMVSISLSYILLNCILFLKIGILSGILSSVLASWALFYTRIMWRYPLIMSDFSLYVESFCANGMYLPVFQLFGRLITLFSWLGSHIGPVYYLVDSVRLCSTPSA